MTVYKSMREQKIKPSNVTFSILVKIYGKSKQLQKALGVLEEMTELGIKPGVFVYTCIIQTCIKSKQFNIALEKFEEMKALKIQGDAVTYQTLLKGCLQFKKFSEGANLLEEAISYGLFITKEITEPLFSGMAKSKDKQLASRVSELKDAMKNTKKAKPSYNKNKFDDQNKFENKNKYSNKWNNDDRKEKSYENKQWNNKKSSNVWRRQAKPEESNEPEFEISTFSKPETHPEEEEKVQPVVQAPVEVPIFESEKPVYHSSKLKTNSKVFVPTKNWQILEIQKNVTSNKVTLPKMIEDKENNMNINNNEGKTKKVPFGIQTETKPKQLATSGEGQRKVLGDSKTHATSKKGALGESHFIQRF